MSLPPDSLLFHINFPQDLKNLKEEELPRLCGEIREFIIEQTANNPGHLGSSLGAVELAVAIHYVFDTPFDRLIWDVGHQAYAHKILTGRREQFSQNRKYKGISGFPKMSESEYDSFGVGHSSTSISAVLGMAVASSLKENNGRLHIAVIGDGAIAAGMALEAMNNAGVSNANMLVILNDNGIAIDQSVGALSQYLLRIVTSPAYNKFRDKIWILMGGRTKYGKNSRAVVKQIGNAVKSSILKGSNLFEALNFRYFGPVDGHDVIKLTKLLRDLKNIQGPKLLHVITVKGKGFHMAEKEKTIYHAPGTFDKDTGELVETENTCPGKKAPKYQTVFGRTLLELAELNPLIVGITPAMPTGSSLNIMMHQMPHRAFDVGIAEQHAVTFSAGLAAEGMIPFCNIYSTFLQRAYDQLIHDVALQKLHVVFCLDRGGLVGEDGATHHGIFDMAYLRSVPNMIIASPLNERELRNLMYTAQLEPIGPFAIRYPRGRGVMPEWKTPFEKLDIGRGRLISDGSGIAILSIGPVGNTVIEAIEQLKKDHITPAHYDMRFLKPLDADLLQDVFKRFSKIITVEDGTVVGGLGSAVLEYMADHSHSARVYRLGVPDQFIEQGTIQELQAECGYDPKGIIRSVKEMINE
ncbi:MAG TPA: 1-deoxy-D-xylulose-5-phosphate synthase [Bacteroidales bacterium]|nr:1-deoxy-D-xylulose-5-phosphate synthase [Bacteroidales bacterium]HNS46080.1 1-deoxy-D-xylulose-5-phosphate synthase [Bacteroidales bacterium]